MLERSRALSLVLVVELPKSLCMFASMGVAAAAALRRDVDGAMSGRLRVEEGGARSVIPPCVRGTVALAELTYGSR